MSWRVRALCLLPMLIGLTGCNSTFQAVNRRLPPVDAVIRSPAPRPVAKPKERIVTYAGRALQYGDENASRLLESRQNYKAVSDMYYGN
jgi:hypothetical protein